MDDKMEEKDWRRLLDRMKEGTVVPVIGSRLLVGADGSSSLYAPLARQLLAEHKVKSASISLPAFRELPEAVALLKGQLEEEDFDDLYSQINNALNQVKSETATLPLPLRQLAGIRDFKLMVTLTADDLIATALEAQGRTVNAVVHSPRLSTRLDLDPDWDRASSDAVQLLYLFGRARPTPLFAIHDEDVLEYAHNVISHGNNVPSIFLDALRERNLLLIGCNFPDWLSRFFLRATRKGPLAESKSKAWLVDRLSSEDPFIGFLDTYSPKTSVLSNVDPVQFVAELAERWHADQPKPPGGSARSADTAASTVAATATADTPAQPDRPVFFISYSRKTDLEHALKLKQALTTELKVKDDEIWFDKDNLEPGDIYTHHIFDGIRNCQYFLPVVSHQATQRDEAFVFREWGAATERLLGMNRKFVLPLVVDDTCDPEVYDETSVREWRAKNVNFWHAPKGTPGPAALKSLQELLRKARSAPGSTS